eukprot:UN12519
MNSVNSNSIVNSSSHGSGETNDTQLNPSIKSARDTSPDNGNLSGSGANQTVGEKKDDEKQWRGNGNSNDANQM